MVPCSRCNNETRTAVLLTSLGEVMVSGPAGSEPLPVSAQVCVACGHIDLYAPQGFEQPEPARAEAERPIPLQELLGERAPTHET